VLSPTGGATKRTFVLILLWPCFLFQGFSNGALGPLGGHGAVLWGPQAEAFTR